MSIGLSTTYEAMFERLLAGVAAATDPDVPLVPFWPLRGAAYDGELLVIGRSVNGWVEDWTARQLGDPAQRRLAVDVLRRDAEPVAGDRMAWVTDLWGASRGYNTRKSAFWRVLSPDSPPAALPTAGPGGSDGRTCTRCRRRPAEPWRRSPACPARRRDRDPLARAGGARPAPGARDDRRLDRTVPRWSWPCRAPTSGLVEGVAERDRVAWVVAKHPMRKPERAFVAAVRAAFEELGRPLD